MGIKKIIHTATRLLIIMILILSLASASTNVTIDNTTHFVTTNFNLTITNSESSNFSVISINSTNIKFSTAEYKTYSLSFVKTNTNTYNVSITNNLTNYTYTTTNGSINTTYAVTSGGTDTFNITSSALSFDALSISPPTLAIQESTNITANITGVTDLSTITVTVKSPDGISSNYAMSDIGNWQYRYVYSFTSLPGTYYVTFINADGQSQSYGTTKSFSVHSPSSGGSSPPISTPISTVSITPIITPQIIPTPIFTPIILFPPPPPDIDISPPDIFKLISDIILFTKNWSLLILFIYIGCAFAIYFLGGKTILIDTLLYGTIGVVTERLLDILFKFDSLFSSNQTLTIGIYIVIGAIFGIISILSNEPRKFEIKSKVI